MSALPPPPPAPGIPTDEPASSRRGAVLVGAGILLSRLAGLARERVIAGFLGLGFANDAFRTAVRIPNLLQNLLGEGVLSASFIPVYARLLAEGDEEGAGRVAGAVAGLLALLTGVLVVVGVVLAEPITAVLAPGFTGARFDLAVRLTRILTPAAGVLVLSAWCLGVLNSHRRFFLSYVAPVVWNAAQIAALVAAGLWVSDQAALATALAWGALAGGVLQFAVQLPAVRRLATHLRPSARTDLPGVREAVRRFGPVVAGRGVVQLSAYVDLVLASYLVVGAVAALAAAQVLALLPISLFGMSVAAAELPELSRVGDRDMDRLRRRLDDGLGRIAFYVVPTVAAYLVVGDLLVSALLQTGRFGAEESRLVWYVLGGYAVGLLATTGARLLQSSLYATGDTRTPALVAAARVTLAAALGVVLMLQLDRVALVPGGLAVVGDLPALTPVDAGLRRVVDLRLGALGLSLASGLAAWLELTLLRRAVARAVGPVRLGGGQLPSVAVAGAAAAAAALAARLVVGDLHPVPAAALALAPAAAAYLGTALALRVPEAEALLAAARRRLHR